MTSGYLVTLEGIDGSGKSTVANTLTDSDFTTIANDVTFTREPTASEAGQLLRQILATGDSDLFAELFLFMADHGTHLAETIRPALEQDELVICDRYIDSRCAYQGYTLEPFLDQPIRFVRNLHTPWSRFPDCTILLDLPPEIAVERTSTGEKYEQEDRLEAIRENYHELQRLDPDRFVIVDATQSADNVKQEVIEIITERVSDRELPSKQ